MCRWMAFRYQARWWNEGDWLAGWLGEIMVLLFYWSCGRKADDLRYLNLVNCQEPLKSMLELPTRLAQAMDRYQPRCLALESRLFWILPLLMGLGTPLAEVLRWDYNFKCGWLIAVWGFLISKKHIKLTSISSFSNWNEILYNCHRFYGSFSCRRCRPSRGWEERAFTSRQKRTVTSRQERAFASRQERGVTSRQERAFTSRLNTFIPPNPLILSYALCGISLFTPSHVGCRQTKCIPWFEQMCSLSHNWQSSKNCHAVREHRTYRTLCASQLLRYSAMLIANYSAKYLRAKSEVSAIYHSIKLYVRAVSSPTFCSIHQMILL